MHLNIFCSIFHCNCIVYVDASVVFSKLFVSDCRRTSSLISNFCMSYFCTEFNDIGGIGLLMSRVPRYNEKCSFFCLSKHISHKLMLSLYLFPLSCVSCKLQFYFGVNCCLSTLSSKPGYNNFKCIQCL